MRLFLLDPGGLDQLEMVDVHLWGQRVPCLSLARYFVGWLLCLLGRDRYLLNVRSVLFEINRILLQL